ncbi:MAG TPA: alpha/beta hydrolase [Sphingomicrobium sp.]|nr:alpha/beta hydrolase [Sphingomicrobium sp.]
MERRTFLGGGAALLAATAAQAQDKPTPFAGDPSAPFFPPKERFPLWPGKPPGALARPIVPNWTMNNPPPGRELWIRGVPFPEVHVYRPARADGSALLILPGGGYEFLSVQNEGLDPAERFNAERTTAFVLTYRLPVDGWSNRSQVALQDAQRAMRLIRSRAADFRIDPARLGVLGFSAGGHLAADLAVSHTQQLHAPIDAADALSAKPAFIGLIYPVVSLDTAISHGDSAPNLLGPNPPPELVAARSPALHVARDTPPSFVAAAMDDGFIQPENSLLWVSACRNAGAPVEAHFFADGGHGFGLHLPKDLPGSRWPDLFALWMRKHGG